MSRVQGLLVRLTACAVVVATSAGQAHAQSSTDDPRILEVRTVPEIPSLAEPFAIQVLFRSGPGWSLVMPDTLVASEHVRSIGAGSWATVPAAGDSVDVLASYPVVGFVSGPVVLPSVELRLARVAGNAVGVRGVGEDGAIAGGQAAEVRVTGLGATRIAPFPPIQALLDADSALIPREPADVLGRNWSLGVILAGILTGLVAAAVSVAAVRRWWVVRGTAIVSRLRGQTPRQQALRELEEIRASGWHRNGRIDAFYDETTGTLRRFAERLDPRWHLAMTSTELVAGIEERWENEQSRTLRSAIEVSERVKFGGHRPDPESAEADWCTVRDWVRDAPES